MKGLLLIFAMLAGSQNPPAADVPRGDAQNGKTLFMKYGCYECHGREGQGSNATGPRLNQNPITYPRFVAYIRKPSGGSLRVSSVAAKAPGGGQHSVAETVGNSGTDTEFLKYEEFGVCPRIPLNIQEDI